MIRRALGLVVASAILAAGAWFIAYEFFYAAYKNAWLVMGGAGMVGVGGYWLWEDFLAPLLPRMRQ